MPFLLFTRASICPLFSSYPTQRGLLLLYLACMPCTACNDWAQLAISVMTASTHLASTRTTAATPRTMQRESGQ